MSHSSNTKENSIPITTELRLTRSTIPTYYATTANGFITNELWKKIIASLVERLSAFKEGTTSTFAFGPSLYPHGVNQHQLAIEF